MNSKTIPPKTSDTPPVDFSFWRPKWFLITRFFAIYGVAFALLLSYFIFEIENINYPMLIVLDFLLLIINIGFWIFANNNKIYRVAEKTPLKRPLAYFIILQINVDLVLLTLMLHYGGGATNPFILYYFFHSMIASILLSKITAYIEAFIAALLFSGMTILEGVGLIDHYPLLHTGYHTQLSFIVGMCFALTSALLIAVYMATSIMDRLRLHQSHLEQALAEQKRLEEEKSRFFDVVAHDLKSPLSAIETMVNSALTVYKDKMDPDVRKIMERIPVRTNNLIVFIRELLDFSTITSQGGMTNLFKPLNLSELVTTTIEIHKEQALDKGIVIKMESSQNIPPILGYNDHLEHVVTNLLSNALRYTPENGSITIYISTDNGNVIMKVSDSGIGIPANSLSSIFKQFYRASNAKKHYPSGSGLGMSLTQAIVTQHGGTISVQSEEGVGTIFTVVFPAAENAPETSI